MIHHRRDTDSRGNVISSDISDDDGVSELYDVSSVDVNARDFELIEKANWFDMLTMTGSLNLIAFPPLSLWRKYQAHRKIHFARYNDRRQITWTRLRCSYRRTSRMYQTHWKNNLVRYVGRGRSTWSWLRSCFTRFWARYRFHWRKHFRFILNLITFVLTTFPVMIPVLLRKKFRLIYLRARITWTWWRSSCSRHWKRDRVHWGSTFVLNVKRRGITWTWWRSSDRRFWRRYRVHWDSIFVRGVGWRRSIQIWSCSFCRRFWWRYRVLWEIIPFDKSRDDRMSDFDYALPEDVSGKGIWFI